MEEKADNKNEENADIQYPRDKFETKMNTLKMIGVGVALLVCLMAVYVHLDREEKFEYPIADNFKKVGKYPKSTNVGGGVFYDEVLEYRVWLNRTKGAETFKSYAMYEEAYFFAKQNKIAEGPVVLVLQKEWVEEVIPGKFVQKKGERITEWPVELLEKGPRQAGDIKRFLVKK